MKKRHNTDRLFILQISLIIICLVAAFAFVAFINKPKIKEITLTEECQLLMGSVLHPMPTKESCEMQCRAYCISFDYSYKEAEFVYGNEQKCNDCKCVCIIR
jgi:hypothetical protein